MGLTPEQIATITQGDRAVDSLKQKTLGQVLDFANVARSQGLQERAQDFKEFQTRVENKFNNKKLALDNALKNRAIDIDAYKAEISNLATQADVLAKQSAAELNPAKQEYYEALAKRLTEEAGLYARYGSKSGPKLLSDKERATVMDKALGVMKDGDSTGTKAYNMVSDSDFIVSYPSMIGSDKFFSVSPSTIKDKNGKTYSTKELREIAHGNGITVEQFIKRYIEDNDLNISTIGERKKW